MKWMFQFPWGTLATSTAVAVATGVAILGFGAPPAVLVPVAWASATIYMGLNSRFNRRLGRR